MSTSRPETLADWAAYIATLDGERLVSKARAANTYDFAARLLDEGLTMDEAETVYVLFARQIARCDVRVGLGLYDLEAWAVRVPPIAIELPPQAPPVDEQVDDDGAGDD